MAFGADFGGGIVSALGGMASSALSSAMSYAYSKKLMRFQQKWQEKMSNTAHQREVTDLKKAGLNPILSGTGGDGASSGAASGATVGADFDNPVSAYQEYKTNKLNQDLLKAQEKNTTSNTYKTNNETDGIIADNMFKHEINEATYEKLLSEVKTNTALQQVYVADEIGKSIDNLFRYDKNNREIDKLKAEAYALIKNANSNALSASSNVMNANTNAKFYKLESDVQSITRDKEDRYKQWGAKHPILRNMDETIGRYIGGSGASGYIKRGK